MLILKMKSFVIKSRLMADKRIRELGTSVDALKQLVNHQQVVLDKPRAQIYREIANFLLNSGQPEIAQDYFKLSLKQARTPASYSLYLQCHLLNPSCTDEELYREAIKYNHFYSDVKRYSHYSNELNPNKKLKVGYLCHFFHNCISQSLLVPFIKAHDRERVTVFCYSEAHPRDVSDSIKSAADVWRDTHKMSDEALAELIWRDQVDVLLECNGHCVVNRYGVISRKPAPVQISYYNFSATTGVSAIDYMMVGDETVLNQSAHCYTESIYYLKGVKNAVDFSRFPDCAPLPCLRNGYITFGSFNQAHKVNHAVIKLWSKVLKKIPDAKFYMKASVLQFDDYKNAYKKIFEKNGIDGDRVIFEGASEHNDMLRCYGQMDIGLDTFPHGGGATTMEALWQGVPVLSLYGERYAFQYGKMILNSIGHKELVAYSEDEFVSKAVTLVQDKERLMRLRNQLRHDFKQSPRADVAAFAKKLEDAYQDMWGRYVESVMPAPAKSLPG